MFNKLSNEFSRSPEILDKMSDRNRYIFLKRKYRNQSALLLLCYRNFQLKYISCSFSIWLLEAWKGPSAFSLTQHGMFSLSLPTKLLRLFQGPFQKLFSMELSPQYKSELITSSYGLSKHFEPLNGNYFTLPCTIYMFKYVCLTRL